MTMIIVKANGRKERGMALLLALFALLLLSAIGLSMVMASDTETRIDANYGSNLRSYYAARSGLEEIRDRRSEEHTSELQSPCNLVCRLLLEKKKAIGTYSNLLVSNDPKSIVDTVIAGLTETTCVVLFLHSGADLSETSVSTDSTIATLSGIV